MKRAAVRYLALFNASPLPMWVTDIRTSAFLAMNDAAVSHYGYSREEFATLTLLDIVVADDDATSRQRDTYLDSARASGEDKYEAMAKCYQAYGQVETVTQDGKRITTYKDQSQVAAECNAKVVERARTETRLGDIVAWARVIGVNSNWQSAMPVFTYAAMADASKATCTATELLYSLELALSEPSDSASVANASSFLTACWPRNRDTLLGLLTRDGYVRDNACKFLGQKKALPDDKKWLCPSK